MIKKTLRIVLLISSFSAQAEEKHILDLDLGTFINVLNKVEQIPGIIYGHSEKPAFTFKEKGALSLLYFKYHYEALCKQKNVAAIEATKKLFPTFNPHITPPSQTEEIILLGSDSNKTFEKYYTNEINSMIGEENRKKMIATIIAPLITSNFIFIFDTKTKDIKKTEVSNKELKKDFIALITKNSINKTYVARLTDNKAAMDGFTGQPLFKELGITSAVLLDLFKEKAHTPLENLADALAILAH